MRDSEIGPDNARDITPKPDVGSRLPGPKKGGRGFSKDHVDRETALADAPAQPAAEAVTAASEAVQPVTADPPAPAAETPPQADGKPSELQF